jgi:effector-binding domain-containing protein
MKLLLASLFALLGFSRFFSFPVANDLDQTAPVTANNPGQDTIEKPSFMAKKINLTPMQVLFIHDTAMTAADISGVLNKGYGELFTFIYQQKLQPVKIMSFYHSSHPPFVMDAAIEVNKIPAKLTGRINTKKIKGGNAVVVHYQGTYDQIGIAYTVISNWLTKNNKKAVEPPFEVYLNDLVTVKDPKLLRTDVYQRFK